MLHCTHPPARLHRPQLRIMREFFTLCMSITGAQVVLGVTITSPSEAAQQRCAWVPSAPQAVFHLLGGCTLLSTPPGTGQSAHMPASSGLSLPTLMPSMHPWQNHSPSGTSESP